MERFIARGDFMSMSMSMKENIMAISDVELRDSRRTANPIATPAAALPVPIVRVSHP
jgi:hypothetical protein